MHFKGKDWRRFWGKKEAPKVHEWPSYGNCCKVTQNPHFLNKCKGGTKGNLLKSRPKGCPRWKGPKVLWRKWHYPLISMHLKCKDWNCFRRKQRLQRCWNGQVMAIFGKSPKTRIFLKKKQRGDQVKLLKNRPRSTPRFKGPRALWRKRHYPLICIHLYCKDWKRY